MTIGKKAFLKRKMLQVQNTVESRCGDIQVARDLAEIRPVAESFFRGISGFLFTAET